MRLLFVGGGAPSAAAHLRRPAPIPAPMPAPVVAPTPVPAPSRSGSRTSGPASTSVISSSITGAVNDQPVVADGSPPRSTTTAPVASPRASTRSAAADVAPASFKKLALKFPGENKKETMLRQALTKLANEIDRLEEATVKPTLVQKKLQVLKTYQQQVCNAYSKPVKESPEPIERLAQILRDKWYLLSDKAILNKDRYSFTWLGPVTLFIGTAIAAFIGLFVGKARQFSAAVTPRLFGTKTRTMRGVEDALKELSEIVGDKREGKQAKL